VTPTTAEAAATRLVVGVDTSEHALRALRWARDEARLRDCTLEVVHAYAPPEVLLMPAVVSLPSDTELEEAAARVVDEAIEEVGGFEGIPIIRTVRAGGAAGVLCRAADDASLVVVGTRGRGGFKELLLGSVSHQVATHASCPVVIVGGEAR
jgi:nucleotide-binding universal stress UspA family protein